MRVAPEGWPFILLAWALVLLAALAGWPVVALILAPIACWVIAFFRDPVREGPRGDRLVIAPADGVVVSIIPIDEPSVVAGAATRVSIFMNVFNVHVNRYPATGEVTRREHRAG
ncbi:MAG: phosphatidylserine decarboxylase, partial [Gemmatimonadetes bacterium]|nr:phosphatidylserine decarboxylase [Gemmatimonadota bacterium]